MPGDKSTHVERRLGLTKKPLAPSANARGARRLGDPPNDDNSAARAVRSRSANAQPARSRSERPWCLYLNGGELTFQTGSARLAQDCKRAKEARNVLTVHLLAANPAAEFTGTVEAVALVSDKFPVSWSVTMVEHRAKPRKRG
jgi:hypothetical protein